MSRQKEIFDLLHPLIVDYDAQISPASDSDLKYLESHFAQKGVPIECIRELRLFYEVFSEIPCLDGVTIHAIKDKIIFESWDTDEELWIGQRDMDIIRWKEGRFHLGDVGNLNYSDDYSDPSLITIIKKGFNDWYPDGYQ